MECSSPRERTFPVSDHCHAAFYHPVYHQVEKHFVRYFVTGCAGFVGSNLTDRLLSMGDEVVGLDDLSTGRLAFLSDAMTNSRFRFVEADLLDAPSLPDVMRGSDAVFHLAGNADVRFGADHPQKDLQQNTIATLNVLEAMRATGVQRLAFSSTGSVYGEATIFPTPEDAPCPIQTSLYGASKVAAESFIQAYSETFGIQAFIFRFVGLVGKRYQHGHVLDFFRQLQRTPERLRVLGDGKQRKSYLDVEDCVDAMLVALERCESRVGIFNLGTDEYCTVDDSIGWICDELGLSPNIEYSGGQRGWIGDNPFIFLDCSRIRGLGWRPRLSIQQGIVNTVRYLVNAPDVLHERSVQQPA